MATFVLVHGAFHGGWCYSRVARELRASGHDVFTPTLTGLGERSHLLRDDTDLETHIQDIVNVIMWEDLHDVVLAGHSYGGFVVTGVADRVPERIRALVSIDAPVPDHGDTLVGLLPEAMRAAYEKAKVAFPGRTIPPAPAKYLGLHSAADVEWVDAKSTPQPRATFEQTLELTGAFRTVRPRVLIYAVGGARDAHYRALAADRDWIAHGVEDSGHDIMIDQPAALAAVLVESALQL